jgi:hypothetical protein
VACSEDGDESPRKCTGIADGNVQLSVVYLMLFVPAADHYLQRFQKILTIPTVRNEIQTRNMEK